MRFWTTSDGLLRSLCWTLVVVVIVGAITTLGLSLDLFVKPPDIPDTTDFVERLIAFRAFDQSIYPIILVGSLFTLGTFLVVALLGPALRPFAEPGSARDVMAVAFVIAGVLGLVSQFVGIATAQEAASIAYCDCGYKTEEVIAQARALGIGFTAQSWLSIGAVVIIGLAASLAGRLVNVSSTWTTLSYLIAVVLWAGAALRFLGFYQESDLLVAVGAGIAVPIWAILLARGTRRFDGVAHEDAVRESPASKESRL